MQNQPLSRREFFKSIAGKTISTGTALTLGGSTAYTIGVGLTIPIRNKNTTPVKEQKTTQVDPPFVKDIKINGFNVQLYGVSHSREFAQNYFNDLEERIAKSSIVVCEANPISVKDKLTMDTAASYFETIIELCEKYKKPILSIDSASLTARMIEISGSVAGGYYAFFKSKRIVFKNSNRRDFIRNSLKTSAGTYFFLSGLITGMGLKSFVYSLCKKEEKSMFRGEAAYINHLADQRNVELTRRLQALPQIIDQKELTSGDYVFFNFGEGHAIGVDYYLHHPDVLKLKSAIYSVSYNLVDSNKIVRFDPAPDGWKETPLSFART